MVCSTPHALSTHALSPDTLSHDTLSPRALSTDGLRESVFIVKRYEESPVSLIYDVRNTSLDRFHKENIPAMLDFCMYLLAH